MSYPRYHINMLYVVAPQWFTINNFHKEVQYVSSEEYVPFKLFVFFFNLYAKNMINSFLSQCIDMHKMFKLSALILKLCRSPSNVTFLCSDSNPAPEHSYFHFFLTETYKM